MAVAKGDLIKASEYNNYVMGLDYNEIYNRHIKGKGGGVITDTFYRWVRGSRTDKDEIPLPVPYPSYNTFKMYLDRSFGHPFEAELHVARVTWGGGGEEIITPVSGSPFTDTSTWSNGTTYYRYFDPGYYKFDAKFVYNGTTLLNTNMTVKLYLKPWQNQVTVDANLRGFLPDREGLGNAGTTLEYIAGDVSKGLYADPFYQGGNHPDYVGD